MKVLKSGIWKTATPKGVLVGGLWKEPRKVWALHGGIWTLVWEAPPTGYGLPEEKGPDITSPVA